MKTLTLVLMASAASAAFGQIPAFPSFPLPAAVAAFGEFNQLGSPKFTMGISALYPLSGSVGIYGTTTADILPKRVVDPGTKRAFYSLSASLRQGVHKDILDVGSLTFLIGGDLGPSFGSAQPSGINISLSSSFVATALYQVSPALSVIAPVRMVYISGLGWNPIAEMGVVVNLRKVK